ncbi:MAG: ScyD/ScyE family protein [Anaerolineae bacterium]|nr:ScyD/ScyE family protein [Anaerolineae bacterium]
MKTKFVVAVAVLLFMVAGSVVQAQGGGETVATGLNAPMGVLVAPDGTVWVIDSGMGGDEEIPFISPETGQEITAQFGESARIVQIAADGTQSDVATLPSVLAGMESIGGARLAMVDGTLYATAGQMLGELGTDAMENSAAVLKIEDGQVSEVASTWVIERDQNPDGTVVDSHPYGLTAAPDGSLWVTDAGANDLLKVDPTSGDITLVTAFDAVPSPLPSPTRDNALLTDPVPTGVVVDDSGTAYVALLPGFPFVPGSSKVVQVSSGGEVSDYATGLTMLTDLRMGPDGNMYAVQVGQFTDQGPVPNMGRIIRIKEGDASEVVVDGLSFPTSIDFNDNGDAYVTINGVGAPGSGEVVMFANVTDMEGTPVSEADAAAAASMAEEGDTAMAEGDSTEAMASDETAPATEETVTELPTTGGEPVVVFWHLVILGAALWGVGRWVKGYATR